MSSIYGDRIKITIFGQSHGEAIGVVVDGLPSGFAPDMDELQRFLARRAPGQALTTPRREADSPRFVSGLYEGKTCGAPLCALIGNTDAASGDYAALRDMPRPGHADYPAAVKYGGCNDPRGGGHFSARLTAPLCVAGGLLMQLLREKGVVIGAQIVSVGKVGGTRFDPVSVDAKTLLSLSSLSFPTLAPDGGEAMLAAVEEAQERGDSVGGVIECCAVGLPVGIGEPMFCGLENEIAKALFAVPAVKGVEFGSGFAGAETCGSENNDAYAVLDGQIRTVTNNAGGILGGLSNGMPLVFRAAFKPTPSIALEQDTVRLSDRTPARLSVRGRHDPCVVLRAAPCVESTCALALAQFLL